MPEESVCRVFTLMLELLRAGDLPDLATVGVSHALATRLPLSVVCNRLRFETVTNCDDACG